MLPWMIALNPLVAQTAHAVDVEVRHLGFVETYRVQPGEEVTDTWYKVPLPEEAGRRRARVDRRPDVSVSVAVSQVGEGALAIEVHLVQELNGRVLFESNPTLLVAASEQVGRMQVGKKVALVDEAKTQGNRLRFRRLTRPSVEVTVMPEGLFAEEAIRAPVPASSK